MASPQRRLLANRFIQPTHGSKHSHIHSSRTAFKAIPSFGAIRHAHPRISDGARLVRRVVYHTHSSDTHPHTRSSADHRSSRSRRLNSHLSTHQSSSLSFPDRHRSERTATRSGVGCMPEIQLWKLHPLIHLMFTAPDTHLIVLDHPVDAHRKSFRNSYKLYDHLQLPFGRGTFKKCSPDAPNKQTPHSIMERLYLETPPDRW